MDVQLSRPAPVRDGLSRRRQWMFAVAGTLVVGIVAVGAWLVLRPGYQVLFRDLKPRDASAIVAELDKQKVPYRIDEATSAILVPEDDTRATRLKLLSGDLKLTGVVGLELFNNSDLGLTDFAQKVNYQRALQGELARTIMTLDEIELARVHLTLPDASIFRREQAQPKASVAVFVRDGETLTGDTIRGIQRLVAAAVPEMKPADVTVLDSRGSASDAGPATEVDDPRFALRRAVEDRLQNKVEDVLAPVLGASHATVSVTADIDYDQSRITRETDAGAAHAAETVAAVDTEERAPRGALPPLPPGGLGNGAATATTPTHRTLEQIVGAPGSIRRLSIGVALDQDKLPMPADTLKSLISAAVGLDAKRGDVLTVVGFAPAPSPVGPDARLASSVGAPALTTPRAQSQPPPRGGQSSLALSIATGVVLVLLLVAVAGLLARRWRGGAAPDRLREDERAALAAKLRLLLEQETPSHVRS